MQVVLVLNEASVNVLLISNFNTVINRLVRVLSGAVVVLNNRAKISP